MLRHVPGFILDQYATHQLAGSIEGFALLFDIADFTPIGTQFRKQGKQGAEELSKFMDYVFGEPIRIVERCGGFVSQFAGDAFCAIFPSQESSLSVSENTTTLEPILCAAVLIDRFFQDNSMYRSPWGVIPLKIRQCLAYGAFIWVIYENNLQNEFVFSGKPMQDLRKLSDFKENLLFSEDAAHRVGLEYFIPAGAGGYFLLDTVKTTIKEIGLTHQISPIYLEPSTLADAQSRFLNPRYHLDMPEPQIRSAAFCFINLDEVRTDQRQEIIARIQSLADMFGGFINKYDETDKGFTGFVLFGLPHSEGKTLERISDFALQAVETIPCLAIGLSCGSVFAGFTGFGKTGEYTALGDPVNLASRLMSKARAGEVLTDFYLWQELHAMYDFSYLGSLNLKGIEHPIRYYRLIQSASTSKRDEHRFVGREAELGMIHDIVSQAISQKENAIVYVHGDAGIGKSRLVSEAMAAFRDRTSSSLSSNDRPASGCLIFSITCNAIVRRPLDAIKQILSSHFFYNPALPAEAGIALFRALWSQISDADSEMLRIESLLAALLGIEWENSIWSILPPEERQQLQRNAFVYFIRKLSETNTILINLDDAQWLDAESLSYFQALSVADIKSLIIICPCRYSDDGSRIELNLSRHRRFDLELSSLDEDGCNALIGNIMRTEKIPAETMELVFNRSMGNPLFIEQLSSYLMETGCLNDKCIIVKELGFLNSFSISDIINSRIDQLAERVKTCLSGASVIGMEFSVCVLSEMLKSDLTKELEAGTNRRIWKDLDELRYIFRHILIKEIVYQRMMSDKLKELHRMAAEAMVIVYQDRLNENAEEIATQYLAAGMDLEAAEYFDISGVWHTGRYVFARAEACLLKAREIKTRILGCDHPETASSELNYAILLTSKGQYPDARDIYAKVLAVFEQSFGLKHPKTILCLEHMALNYHLPGWYEQAETMYHRALVANSKMYGKDHIKTIICLGSLAKLYIRRKKYDFAERLLQRILPAYEVCYGERHPETAMMINNMANLYHKQGKFAEAEQLFLKAIAICEESLMPGDIYITKVLNRLADMYQEQNMYAQAEPLRRRAVDLRESVLGGNHPGTASMLGNLAQLYQIQGKYSLAEPIWIRLLDFFDSYEVTDHSFIVEALMNLGSCYLHCGSYDLAEANYQQALESCSRLDGQPHPCEIEVLKCLIRLYEKKGEPDKAARYKVML